MLTDEQMPPLPAPAVNLHDDGYFTWLGAEPYRAGFAGWRDTAFTASQMREYARAVEAKVREQTAERKPQWIPMSERTPKHRQVVLIAHGKHIESAKYWTTIKGDHDDPDLAWQVGRDDWIGSDDVTHWMPLPPPPSTQEKS